MLSRIHSGDSLLSLFFTMEENTLVVKQRNGASLRQSLIVSCYIIRCNFIEVPTLF
jgi:hypothetical protein